MIPTCIQNLYVCWLHLQKWSITSNISFKQISPCRCAKLTFIENNWIHSTFTFGLKLTTRILQLQTSNLQLATCHSQITIVYSKLKTCNLQLTTNVPMYSLQLSTDNLQLTIYNSQLTANNLQFTTYNLQKLKPTKPCNLLTTYSLQLLK